jgi:hypothetical protein
MTPRQGGGLDIFHGVAPLLDGDATDHARFKMAGDQAGKLKAACTVKGPDDGAFLAGVHMRQ